MGEYNMPNKMVTLNDCMLMVVDNEVRLLVDDVFFIFGKDEIEEVLEQGWGEDESMYSTMLHVTIELYPSDYRYMLTALD